VEDALARSRSALWQAALVLILFFPSAQTIQQYLGSAAIIGYLAGLAIAVPLALRYALPLYLRLTTERSALWLALLTLAVLIVLFAVIYPKANAGALGGLGSDRDDAANLATRHLLHFEYPYSTPTYLGNLVSQLPGALIINAPFVAIGNSAYQNIFWLMAFFFGLRYVLKDARLALFGILLLLLASPELMREYLTGGDLIANSIYILLFMLGVLLVPNEGRARWLKLGAAAALGIALSSRANFVFVMPLLVVAQARREGWRPAAVTTAITAATCTAVTLPFYLYSPSRFSPLLTRDKVEHLDSLLPGLSTLLLGVGGLLALLLAWRRARDVLPVFASCALVQGFLVFSDALASSIQEGQLDLGLLGSYGLFVLIFGAFALWGSLQARAP
jgi:hypothetical protein